MIVVLKPNITRKEEQAVVREVQEEAGVTAEVEGVLGLRNRYDPDSGENPRVDTYEVDMDRCAPMVRRVTLRHGARTTTPPLLPWNGGVVLVASFSGEPAESNEGQPHE